ncbi:PWWP domain-containing protein [Ophiocordyceps camponoti-floridani]|uniref:PWWP domain-containing protein n=1 Tax=Ophiocordyceps camponoti-floridani TaxID=2030778 RepID=A0A8H4Q721_9HYPO|nr:PWWP domain-containing protein [Ophiocordyceps camponoti-floridani]
MADKPTDKPASIDKAATPTPQGDGQEVGEKEASNDGGATKLAEAEEAPDKTEAAADDQEAVEKPSAQEGKEHEKADADVEMKDAAEEPAAPEPGPVVSVKTKGAGRRKSSLGEAKGKTLAKKASKARLSHVDAKPGDHFLVKLKGHPAWPAIVCDETMLPAALISSRPVSAARSDGSYAEAYADGGKRVHDRSFPVMYLYTNEFGWAQNSTLSKLTAEKAKDTITEKMRKDLRAAYELAAEHNDVDHYKEILQSFQEEQIAQEEARKQTVTLKRAKKGKGKALDDDDDLDIEMDDANVIPKSAKSKKRKAEDDTSTPQRPDSVKKPKIKLNTSSTPKTANGAATPKSAGASAAKGSKSKPKKAKDGGDKKAETPKEAKMTPEERRARKEKEVLYLRHKLQRGLLTREQQPREDEMKTMSDFVTVLENMVDLEVSIIRATKINKVLKAILKLDSIPREEDFEFKKRSQSLLDKWNKLLADDGSGATTAPTNGVNGAAEEKKGKAANGVKDDAREAPKADSDKDEPDKTEEKGGEEDSVAKDSAAEDKAEGAVEDKAEAAEEKTETAEEKTETAEKKTEPAEDKAEEAVEEAVEETDKKAVKEATPAADVASDAEN